MIIKERIQKSVGQFTLRRLSRRPSRSKQIVNLSIAEKVGVLFNPANKEELAVVKGFLGFLTKLEIKVFPLAFLDSKRNNIETVLEKHINFVEKKDFNWYHKPLSPKLIDFIRKDFDILINLSLRNSMAVNYIVAKSKARFKVGKYFENLETYCDLMIDVTKSDNLPYLIEQISHYLSVINSTK